MSHKHCAYLTMTSMGDFVSDQELSILPMRELGWSVELVPWQQTGVDWEQFTAVYIATPWDYPDDPEAFMALLEEIDRSSAVLVNDIELVRWTMRKTYLRDLESRGADIVPSLWGRGLDAQGLDQLFRALDVNTIVVKPVVSTNATDTYLLNRPVPDAMQQELAEVFAARDYVAQPFIGAIQSEGEYSLFFFDEHYSHAILKTPKAADFRVQEEHGAAIVPTHPEQTLLATAQAVLGLVSPTPVYTRADFVRAEDGRFLVMELEIIEPSLYFRTCPESPARFARAFDNYVSQQAMVARRSSSS